MTASVPVLEPGSTATTADLDAVLERALSEPRLVAYIARASAEVPHGWRAAAWLLERRFPQRWAARRPAEADPPAPTRPVGWEDPFGEVDELAERRRQRLTPD